MRKYVFISMVVVLTIVQVVFPAHLMVWGVGPDLLLLCAIMAGILFERKFAIAVGIFIGLLKDTFGSGGGVINTVLFPLWSGLIVWFSRKVSLSDPIIRTVLVAIVAVSQYLLSGFLYVYTGKEITPGIFMKIVCINTVYTTLFSFVICYFIEELLPQEKIAADFEVHPW